MAYVNAERGQRAGIVDRLAEIAKSWSERRQRHALYRRTLDELSVLSDRELADLGVHRSEVARIAYEAAYSS